MPIFDPLIGSGSLSTTAPVAVIVASPQFGVVGSVVKLDGRQSYSPTGAELTFTWEFSEPLPIGSKAAIEGFRILDDDGSTVTFSPDVVGVYGVKLTVSDGTYDSVPVFSTVSIRAILVPDGRGIVPDGKFIWSYLRDVWKDVDGKEWFETLWSALIQIVGGELLKTWQVDYNKSIRDIQDKFQRRWLAYEPKLSVDSDNLEFYLGNFAQGRNGLSAPFQIPARALILDSRDVVIVQGTASPVVGQTFSILSSLDTSNVGSYKIVGQNAKKNSYRFDRNLNANADRILFPTTLYEFDFVLGSKTWTVPSPPGGGIPIGAYVYFNAGPNAGFYRVTGWDGSHTLTVATAPSGFSNATTSAFDDGKAGIYLPIDVQLPTDVSALTDTIGLPIDASVMPALSLLVPGRLITFGGRDYIDGSGNTVRESGQQAFTILRSLVDYKQSTPLTVVSVDKTLVPVGLQQQNWRLSNTLISDTQDFEALGVSPGDLIIFEVTKTDSTNVVDVNAQVIGVDGNRLAFHFSLDQIQPGQPVSETLELDIIQGFNLLGYTVLADGTSTFASEALAFKTEFESLAWQRQNYNTPLTSASILSIGGKTYQLRPKTIFRNRLISVDDTLVSVPVLQEFVVQPTITQHDGKVFQVKDGVEYELPHVPTMLTENSDYIVDGRFAYSGDLHFTTGTIFVEAEGVDFVDRSILPGDTFIITSPPALQGEYPIAAISGQDKIRLSIPVPLYLTGDVAAKVQIRRKRNGHFIRFVPGLYSATAPAPSRFWGEVSYFDNNDTIEKNFGILVGLRRSDLDAYSVNVSYRQAVAGLMYAFTQGSAVEKVRVGIQILLGLPFAESRGVILSIEPDYRKDDMGVPIFGRVLVEDVDSTGTALGTVRVYLYPIDLASSDLAGVDTNPATGVTYVVGDTVELFAPLCKGVEVDDYLTRPLGANYSGKKQLQQFNSILVRINDNIFGPNEINLVSSFLRKITASYVNYVISITQEFNDTVAVSDNLVSRFRLKHLVDNAGLSLSSALMLDSSSLGGIDPLLLGDAAYTVRRAGRDAATIAGQPTISIPSGGVIDPRTGEVFEAPLCRAGDFILLVNGQSAGFYQIDAGVTDTTVPVTGPNAPAAGFVGETGIRYAILRRVKGKLYDGLNGTFTNGSNVVQLSTGGLRTFGVAPGDWIIVDQTNLLPTRYTITAVLQNGLQWSQVQVTPTPSWGGGPVTAAVELWRPTLIASPEDDMTVSLTAIGTEALGGGTFVGTLCSVSGKTTGYVEIGDEVQIQEDALRRFRVADINVSGSLLLDGVLANGTYTVKVCKRGRPSTGVGFDHLEAFTPWDVVTAALSESQHLAVCANTAVVVTLSMQRTTAPSGGVIAVDPVAMNILPGDLLQLTSGVHSTIDIGLGAGVFPIVDVTNLGVTLSRALVATENCSWKILRRR